MSKKIKWDLQLEFSVLITYYQYIMLLGEDMITFINNIDHSSGPFQRQEIFTHLMLALYQTLVGDFHKE